MASLADLPLRDRIWYHTYRFRRAHSGAWARLRIPLSSARVALVASAGLHRREDPPFERVKGGDWSYRIIPRGTSLDSLVCTHPSSAWDRRGVARDANTALPLERLEEMLTDGVIGDVAPRHISFQGSITAPGRLVAETAPAIARLLADDGVHVVILTPV